MFLSDYSEKQLFFVQIHRKYQSISSWYGVAFPLFFAAQTVFKLQAVKQNSWCQVYIYVN